MCLLNDGGRCGCFPKQFESTKRLLAIDTSKIYDMDKVRALAKTHGIAMTDKVVPEALYEGRAIMRSEGHWCGDRYHGKIWFAPHPEDYDEIVGMEPEEMINA